MAKTGNKPKRMVSTSANEQQTDTPRQSRAMSKTQSPLQHPLR